MDNERIDMIDIKSGKVELKFEGHLDYNFSTTFMDGWQFASGGQDCSTRIWDLRKQNEEVNILPGNKMSISVLKYHPEKKLLFASEAY